MSKQTLYKSQYKEVYAEDGKIVKIFDGSFPKANILNEALNQARVEVTDLNIPKIHEVTKIDGKWAIVMDYIEGKTLAELMREKILLKYDEEIPHGVAVVVHTFRKREDGVYEVGLDIVCEKQAHKAILIGKQGRALKEAASFARKDMEKFLGAKVYLTTYVKVREDWRDSARLIRELGYGEDEA